MVFFETYKMIVAMNEGMNDSEIVNIKWVWEGEYASV